MLTDKSLSGPQDLDQKPSIPCPRQLNPTTVNDYEVRKCLDTYKLSALIINNHQKICLKDPKANVSRVNLLFLIFLYFS